MMITVLIFLFAMGNGTYLPGSDVSTSGPWPVAEEKISSSGITWVPRFSDSRLELTVSPPEGAIFHETFASGVNPAFNISNLCSDGFYTYELRAVPTTARTVRAAETFNSPAVKRGNCEETVQSGNFLVKEGVIITPNSPDQISRPQDIVQNDDLIITGNTCVGSGCATDGSESFGFDSIKIKNANPRIFFDDISSSPYPFNDWRLVINDTSSSGVSHFSIEDTTAGRRPFTIRAGTRSNAFYIDSAGYVGLGTSVPGESLHITNCDTPAIRLEQTTCFGYEAQKWDMVGNEIAFSIRDYTDPANTTLPFMIEPRAPWYTLYLNSDGKVGINVQNPTHLIQLSGGAYSDGGTWVNSSSRDLKENIESLGTDEALDALKNLNPVKFNYKTDKKEKCVGFIAEDVPELVATQDHKGMSPMDVVAVLAKVLQEQQKSIQEQKQTIIELKEKIARLEKK